MSIHSSLIPGLSGPEGIAISGGAGTAALISGLDNPFGVAAYGSDLFVTDFEGAVVDEYTTSGTKVSTPLISAIDFHPAGIVVMPEPSGGVLLGVGAVAVLSLRPHRSRREHTIHYTRRR